MLSGKKPVSPDAAARIDAALGAGGALVELAALLGPDDRARLTAVVSGTHQVDAPTVHALAALLATQRRADDVLPARVLLPGTRTQWAAVQDLARNARGPHAKELATVAAEWSQFLGWLHAEAGHHRAAMRQLADAHDRAADLDHGVLLAQAANFRGYVSRHRRDPAAVVEWFTTAYRTPGATLLQQVGDAVQAAHGHGLLGQKEEARRLLGEASDLLGRAEEVKAGAPPSAYWLSPEFSRLNIGLAHMGIGAMASAAENLAAGLASLPPDQAGAEWAQEYKEALTTAEAA